MNPERRFLFSDAAKAELRADDAAEPMAVGYAAVYYREGEQGTEYELFPDYVERIAPGAFDSVVQDDVRGLINHDVNLLIGRRTAGTLRLFPDERGLRYEIDLPDTTAGRDLRVSLERGDITGSSFSFFADPDNGGETEVVEKDGRYIRTIKKFSRLFDVGPVTFPAYTGTEAGARNAEAAAEELAALKREAERPASCRDAVDVECRIRSLQAKGWM